MSEDTRTVNCIVLKSYYDHDGKVVEAGTSEAPNVFQLPFNKASFLYGCNCIDFLTDEEYAAKSKTKRGRKPKSE